MITHDILTQALLEVERRISQSVDDSWLTVPIIGEMSAGKSRLLAELLRGHLPPALLPVSSLEAQTLLPLEITYGNEASLWEVDRDDDGSVPLRIKEYSAFPERVEIQLGGPRPPTRRLCLSANIEHLKLRYNPAAGGVAKPCRYFLIDTPGWNEKVPDSERLDGYRDLGGKLFLALVYVVNAKRLGGATELSELEWVLRKFERGDFIGRNIVLHVYVTRWDDQDERAAIMRADFEQRLDGIKSRLQLDKLIIRPKYVDLDLIRLTRQVEFQNEFWADLLADHQDLRGSTNPWEHLLSEPEWQTRLQGCLEAIEQAEQIFDRFRVDGKVVKGLNMTRLTGNSTRDPVQRLVDTWSKQIGIKLPLTFKNVLSTVDADHALAPWWNSVFIPIMQESLDAAERLTQETLRCFSALPIDLADLNVHLWQELEVPFQEARHSFVLAESLFPATLRTAMQDGTPLSNLYATLIAITICQVELEANRQLLTSRPQPPKGVRNEKTTRV
jgi:hypothetical protein